MTKASAGYFEKSAYGHAATRPKPRFANGPLFSSWDKMRGMQQRGRKSAASFVVPNVTGSSPRLLPPSSLSDPERKIFAATVAACDHLRQSDLPLLQRYCEIVALSDHAAERLRVDVIKGRPSQWLTTQKRLTKLLISLGRQLRLSPISLSSSDPKTLERSSNGHAPVSAYELMRFADGEA